MGNNPICDVKMQQGDLKAQISLQTNTPAPIVSQLVLSVFFFKHLTKILVFTPRRLKVKKLILNTYTQVIKRFLQPVDAFLKPFVVIVGFFRQHCQLTVLWICHPPKLLD